MKRQGPCGLDIYMEKEVGVAVHMKEYQYQQQAFDGWSGAACLSMVYEKHGISISQAEIFKDMRKAKGEPMLVAEAVQHVRKHTKGALFACAIKYRENRMGKLFSFVSENNVDMIMNHQQKDGGGTTYTLFTGAEGGMVYGLNPQTKDDFPIKTRMMRKLWKKHVNPNGLRVVGNIAILITDDKKLINAMTRCVKCRTDVLYTKIGVGVVKFALCSDCDIMWKIQR